MVPQGGQAAPCVPNVGNFAISGGPFPSEGYRMASAVVGESLSLSSILDQITVSLQLTKSQFERATEGYRGVTDWLGNVTSPLCLFNPRLFPQGSLALDTTVKPIRQVEFDLDVVCLMDRPRTRSPEELFDLVSRRLSAHAVYGRMLEPKDRCIRLDYAAESQFHLDVVPAIPDYARGGSFILIPDGSCDGPGMTFKTANPMEFKAWFFEARDVILEARAKARIDPLENPLSVANKAVLTKCVQLLKRWRDVNWKEDPALATPSIVLTYLAADAYDGRSGLAEAFGWIVEGICRFIDRNVQTIYSPVNDREIISEKWLRKPACFTAFAEEIRKLRREWADLAADAASPVKGLSDVEKRLRRIFGEPATTAVKAASAAFGVARSAGSLGVTKKTATLVASSPVASKSVVRSKPHTFFGN